jgi:hypothetical protein
MERHTNENYTELSTLHLQAFVRTILQMFNEGTFCGTEFCALLSEAHLSDDLAVNKCCSNCFYLMPYTFPFTNANSLFTQFMPLINGIFDSGSFPNAVQNLPCIVIRDFTS